MVKYPIDETSPTISNKSCLESWHRRKENSYNEDIMFQHLKTLRNMECVKLVQASNVLKTLKENRSTDWFQELLAEKILLEADEKYALLMAKIRNHCTEQIEIPKFYHGVTVTFSNFEFLLMPQLNYSTKYNEFYAITLSYGKELMMSNVLSPNNHMLTFPDRFTFLDVDSNFVIKARIFSLKLRTEETWSSLFSNNIRNIATRKLNPAKKIYYEDVNTRELKAAAVLIPSFKCCGEIILTREKINGCCAMISEKPGQNRFLSYVQFSSKVENLRIYSRISGFLTMGVPEPRLLWERRWCVLKGTDLFIYNYPADEDFGKPVFTFNLQHCVAPISEKVSRNTFVIKIAGPGSRHGNEKEESNELIKGYLFKADGNADFEIWTSELKTVLKCVEDWKGMIGFSKGKDS